MNWKKPVFMLGAVLMCTSLLLAAAPPTDIASSQNTVSQATINTQMVSKEVAPKGITREAHFDSKKVQVLLQQQAMARTGATLTRGAPPNDMCADAEVIGVGVWPFTTVNATTDGPDHPDVCEFTGGVTPYDVWFSFTAPEDGQLLVGTCNDADYDSDLVIYDGCDCGDLILLACDDDTTGCAGYTQVIEITVEAGHCYLFRVGSYNASTTPGSGNLTVEYVAPPTGACCVDGVCTGTVEEIDCTGEWYVGEDCGLGFVCPGYCPEDELEIVILTDNYASETTWVLNILGGEQIAAGDPDENATLYSWNVCLDDDLCYEFTIDDTAGDGICCGYGIGYYQLWLNGTMVFEGGEFGGSETTNVGSNCVDPTGACCLELVCTATNTEAECDVLDGRWFAFEDCANFICPEIVAGDECVDAVAINAPYPVTAYGTSIGMAQDCPSLLTDWFGMWYEFELPYADNDVTIVLTAPGMTNTGIIVMNDCACDDYVNDAGYIFDGNSITLHFRLAGPGYWYFPAMAENDSGPMDFSVMFDVTEHVACVVDCEPNEGEPDCYDGYTDLTNGGCNADVPAFTPIACGETICGLSGTHIDGDGGQVREMDWFELNLASPGEVTWSGIGEFPLNLWILSGTCTGGIVTEAFQGVDECVQNTISAILPAGTYMLIAAPSVFEGLPCGLKYEVTVTCEAVTGACCTNDGADCAVTLEGDCTGDWYIGEDCATFTCPVPCTESQIDIAILTDSWGYETSWQITDYTTGAVICEVGPDTYANATLYNERCCIGYTDCVNFTIYDAYGDGIYSPGGYTVMLDGVIVADTMGSGWSGSEETVPLIGGGCIMPTGACCVELDCVATNEQAECAALGGRWFEGEDCATFVCPECADFTVTAPYTSEAMSTCGWGDDCQPANQYNMTEEIVFQVEIPTDGMWNFNTCLLTGFDTWLALGTDCCLDDIAYNDDACGTQSEIIIYLTAGTYFVDVEGYSTCGSFILDIQPEEICELTCPEGASIEGEPCGDDTNGGCNMNVPTFEPIGCNETVCGTIWADGGTRDTDWYEIVAAADDTYTWTVEAEFDMVMGFLEQTVPGVPGCDNLTGYLNPYTTAGDCEEVSVSMPVTAGGTYYLFVSHQTYYDYPCDTFNDYIATLSGDNCGCGDLDADGDVDTDDFWLFLDSFGTCVGDIKYIAEADLDGDGCITLIDYGMWMQCFRDANGGRTFVPQLRRANVSGRNSSGRMSLN